MTGPSDAAKAKALELILKEAPDNTMQTVKEWEAEAAASFPALATFIQQVSDAAKRAIERTNPCHRINIKVELEPFILPEPVDPLVEVFARWQFSALDVENVRAELSKRALKIVKDET